jgi:hypothetical protein
MAANCGLRWRLASQPRGNITGVEGIACAAGIDRSENALRADDLSIWQAASLWSQLYHGFGAA